MATEGPNRDVESGRMRSPLQAAVILYSIFITMFLAVGGAVRLLTPADMDGAIRDEASTEASEAAAVRDSKDGVDDCTSAREENHAHSD